MTTFRQYIEQVAATFEWRAKVYNFLQGRALWVPSWPAANNRLDNAPPDASDIAVDSDALGAILAGPGAVMRYGMVKASSLILHHDLACLDDSVDWRDRLLMVEYQFFASGTADRMPGGANDYNFGFGGTPAAAAHGQLLYTGLGAVDGGANNPTAGNPPVGPGVGQYVTLLDTAATDLALYVEGKVPYRLCVYNKHASTDYALAFRVWGSTRLGKR